MKIPFFPYALYFNFRNYIEALVEMWRLPVAWTSQRVIGFVFLAIIWPLYEIVNHFLLGLDEIFFPEFRRIPLTKPVLMVGNARSGTTFCHRLMTADSRLSSMKTWEVMCPSICAYYIVSAVWYVDHYYLGETLTKMLNYAQDVAMGQLDSIHHGRLNIEEEDDPVLIHIWASTFIRFLAPVECTKRWFYFDKESLDVRMTAMTFYKEMAQRHMYKLPGHGKGYTFLSKNPGFTFKVASLPLVFPDMRMVYLVRNPLDATASALLLFQSIVSRTPGLDAPHKHQSMKVKFEVLLQWYTASYLHALDQLDNHYNNVAKIIIKYDDLVESPLQTMLRIYQTFEMDVPDALRRRWAQEEEKAKTFIPEEFSRITEYGYSEEDMYKELEPVFKRFNFPREPQDAGKSAHNQKTWSRKVPTVELRRA